MCSGSRLRTSCSVDVHLTRGDALASVHALCGSNLPLVIVTSADSESEGVSDDLLTIDYLLKPLDQSRVDDAIERVRRMMRSAPSPLNPAVPVHHARRSHFAVRVRREIIFVRAAQIDWISAAGNYSRLHIGDTSYLLRESMHSLEDALDSSTFIRVHRSAIVNVSRVQKLITSSSSALAIVLISGVRVPLGRTYRGRLQQLLCRM